MTTEKTISESKSFTNAEIWKMGAAFLFLSSMWYDLKTDQIKIQNDIDFLQYQINEGRVVSHSPAPRQTAYFVKPNDIKIRRKNQIIFN